MPKCCDQGKQKKHHTQCEQDGNQIDHLCTFSGMRARRLRGEDAGRRCWEFVGEKSFSANFDNPLRSNLLKEYVAKLVQGDFLRVSYRDFHSHRCFSPITDSKGPENCLSPMMCSGNHGRLDYNLMDPKRNVVAVTEVVSSLFFVG